MAITSDPYLPSNKSKMQVKKSNKLQYFISFLHCSLIAYHISVTTSFRYDWSNLTRSANTNWIEALIPSASAPLQNMTPLSANIKRHTPTITYNFTKSMKPSLIFNDRLDTITSRFTNPTMESTMNKVNKILNTFKIVDNTLASFVTPFYRD